MPDQLEQLVESLLFEGYALYPYTPTATKNATPTPFGIVYPPSLRARLASTFDHLELRCVARGGGRRDAASPRFASSRPAGAAIGRRRSPVALAPLSLAELAAAPADSETRFGELALGLRLSARAGRTVNLRGGAAGREPHGLRAGSRPARRARAFPALHPPAAAGRRRPVPARRWTPACECVNTFPVLATDGRRRRAGRGHRAPRPPPDRAREPRRPVRLDRDRGGAAAARADADRRRARARSRGPTRRSPRWWRGPRPRPRRHPPRCTAG